MLRSKLTLHVDFGNLIYYKNLSKLWTIINELIGMVISHLNKLVFN